MTMHDGTVLDLGMLPQYAPKARRKLLGKNSAKYAVALSGIATAGMSVSTVDMTSMLEATGWQEPTGEAVLRLPFEQARAVEAMTTDDKSQIVAEGLGAQERNAALPLTTAPLEQARGFMLAADGAASGSTALKCLTQAVYYESAFEPIDGRRAVAQVVLNRVRHPAYPKSVCGVVYQGSERRTGCQFSFTCDGSLLRRPSVHAWREAEQVARAALAGHVEKPVGTATHYHADYVLPKWAPQLGKITQLGRHIFYRFNGSWGRSAAFSGRYTGMEMIPSVNFAALSERLLAEDGMGELAVTPGLTVAPHATDRHAETDVGGRLDVTKEWRLAIPDPTEANSRYKQALAETASFGTTTGQVARIDRPVVETPR